MWCAIHPRSHLLLAIASLFVAVLLAKPVSASRCDLLTMNEDRKIVVEAWAVPDARFNAGEQLRLQMGVSSPSFLSLFHVSASCEVTRPINNRSICSAIADIPDSGSTIQIVARPPAGYEAFYPVTTRDAFEFLSGADIVAEAGGMATLDLRPAPYYRRLNVARGRINPVDWSVAPLPTSVVAH